MREATASLVSNSSGKTGGVPHPDGRNRFHIETDDVDRLVDTLRGAGAAFRVGITSGTAGRQILLEDPSGNLIELFKPAGRSR
ncbi:VOC family protein [Tabrizicola sp.]|uniref:VOC family protein n=1 Tax=Tabrizicola sp. TaxID=2005166 RepID=UPI003F3D2B08